MPRVLSYLLLAVVSVAVVHAHPTPVTSVASSSLTERIARQFTFIPSIISGLKREACTDLNQCSFFEHFKWNNAKRWTTAHDYANGVEFNVWWSKYSVFWQTDKRNLRITVDKNARHGKDYVSGQLQSNKWHGYGCYEVRMRPPSQEGLITTFFSYTGKYDRAPGQPERHNEVDLEFVYKRWAKKMMLQANFFTNGVGGNEKLIPLNFDPAKKLHNYAFKWSSKGVEWYVDGKKVYTVTQGTPKIWDGPHKIMMNLWPVSKAASGWGGNYSWRGAKSAIYSGIRFTRGENCIIQNKF